MIDKLSMFHIIIFKLTDNYMKKRIDQKCSLWYSSNSKNNVNLGLFLMKLYQYMCYQHVYLNQVF